MSWTPAKPPVEYRDVIYLEPESPPKRFNVKFVKLDRVADAPGLLAAGKAAWVDAAEWRRVQEGASSGEAVS